MVVSTICCSKITLIDSPQGPLFNYFLLYSPIEVGNGKSASKVPLLFTETYVMANHFYSHTLNTAPSPLLYSLDSVVSLRSHAMPKLDRLARRRLFYLRIRCPSPQRLLPSVSRLVDYNKCGFVTCSLCEKTTAASLTLQLSGSFYICARCCTITNHAIAVSKKALALACHIMVQTLHNLLLAVKAIEVCVCVCSTAFRLAQIAAYSNNNSSPPPPYQQHQYHRAPPVPIPPPSASNPISESKTFERTSDLKQGLSCALINSRSMKNKTELIFDMLLSHKLSFLMITETWLTGNDVFDRAIFHDSCPPSYSYISAPRSDKRGGGLALLFNTALRVEPIPDNDCLKFKSFESLQVRTCSGNKVTIIVMIYRPPSSPLHAFYDEMHNLLTSLLKYENIVILGDFNLSISDPNSYPIDFSHLVATFNLHQHVTLPTHNKHSILDLILTRSDSSLVTNIDIRDGISDHCTIFFNLQLHSNFQPTKNNVTKRFFNPLTLDSLYDDCSAVPALVAGKWFSNSTDSLSTSCRTEQLVSTFNDSISNLLDIHAPIRNKKVRKTISPPWWSSNLMMIRRLLRKLERRYRISGLMNDVQLFRQQKMLYHQQLKAAKTTYVKHILEDFNPNSRSMWRLLNRSLGRGFEPRLPPHDSDLSLAEEFNKFFLDKVCSLRSTIVPSATTILPSNEPPISMCFLTEFPIASEKEVLQTLRSSPNKTCFLDIIPTWVLRYCIDPLLPAITIIANEILSYGMPSSYKHAIVTPLIKKASLNPNELNNYRPVSNLVFLSKVVERLVSKRIVMHLESCKLFDSHQSAYRSHHSCETALISILDTTFVSIDRGEVTLLVLLDLSAAFDTVDHRLLCDKLHAVGIRNDALKWIADYLADRSQSVSINGTVSSAMTLMHGVPQGSVLGPLLFLIYMLGVGDVISNKGMYYKLYADDIQIYTSALPQHLPASAIKMEQCIDQVKDWLTTNFLCLNESKSECILLGTRVSLSHCTVTSIRIGGSHIPVKNSVRDLGVQLDSILSFDSHISNICKNAFTQLRLISRLRKCMDNGLCVRAVDSLVLPHVDYGIALMVGVTKKRLLRIQRCVNSAARVILQASTVHSVSDFLHLNGWLTITLRIHFRILCLMHSVIHSNSPSYLNDILTVHIPVRYLRSSTDIAFVVPSTRTKVAERAFSVTAPKLWNALPGEIRQINSAAKFREAVKHHLLSCG